MAEFIESLLVVNDVPSKVVVGKQTNRGRKRLNDDHTYDQKSRRTEEGTIQQSNERVHEQVHTLKDIDLELYIDLLCRYRRICPVDEHYRAFFLQDYDLKTGSLKKSFHIVQRRVIKTEGTCMWMFCCSCNEARQNYVGNLPRVMRNNRDDYDREPFLECLHIKAVQNISTQFDEDMSISAKTIYDKETEKTPENQPDHSYDDNKPAIDLYNLESVSDVACMRWSLNNVNEYSVIEIAYRGHKPYFTCSTCKVSTCKHVKVILEESSFSTTLDLPIELTKAFNACPKWRSRYVPVSVSASKIPFALSQAKSKRNANENFSHDGDGKIALYPVSTGKCKCNSEFGQLEHEEMPFITLKDMHIAKVHYQRCTACGTYLEYDGVEDGVINMGKYLVAHSVLFSYTKQFLIQGTTLSSFYKQLVWNQIDNNNSDFMDKFPYHRFRHSWYSFLELLEIDYEEGFSCPECGDCPRTVIMDGVSLGTRKLFMPWEKFINKEFKPKLDGSSHNTRIFVNNQKTRTFLQKYIKSGLSQEEFIQLKTLIQQYEPSLNEAMEYLDQTDALTCPTPLVDLFKILCSNYPVCAFLHYNEQVFEILNLIVHGEKILSASDLLKLEEEVPTLTALFRYLEWDVPNYLRAILKALIKKANIPFKKGKCHDLQVCDETCPCRGFGFFPKLKTRCHRGDYILDNKQPKAESVCSKKKSTHSSLLPGIFTVSCVHGICYGFEVMENAESPNIPFTILRTRFHTAPTIIIYDNACNLHAYCLNRDPDFFKNSWFMVDRFHWCNHVGCHAGYNLDSYPQMKKINSQVAEQRNATLKCLKSMLSYMNLHNFILHVKFFVWFRSMINLSVLNPKLPIKDFEYFVSLGKFLTKSHSKS